VCNSGPANTLGFGYLPSVQEISTPQVSFAHCREFVFPTETRGGKVSFVDRWVYKFDGEQLVLCKSSRGDRRPTEFMSQDGDSQYLFVLRRTARERRTNDASSADEKASAGIDFCLINEDYVEGLTHPNGIRLNEASALDDLDYPLRKPTFTLTAKH